MSSLNPLDWMKHKIDVWETMRLDLELDEEGLLARLYDLMHRAGKPIPSDAAWLSRACRVSSRIVKKMLPRLLSAGFITSDERGEFLWAAYVEAELENSAERSNNARKGADARWRGDRKSGGKSAEKQAKSADNPAEPRESREDNRDENREKAKENNESAMRTQCHRDIDIESEGETPTGFSPGSESPSTESVANGPDAHPTGASGPHPVRLFKIGDIVNVPHGEAMLVEKIGFDGPEWFLRLKEDSVFDMDAMIVPLDDGGNPEFARSWWNDGNEAKADRIDWNPKVKNPTPKSRRRRHAAA